MANTEIMAALKQIRLAKVSIQNTLSANPPPIGSPNYNLLSNTLTELDDVQNKLIDQDIQDWIGTIQADGNQLKNLANQIQKDIQGLQAVAKAVQDAATVLGVLASVMAAASSGGLLK
jgi:hypothetical protein